MQEKKMVKQCPYQQAANASEAIKSYEWMNNKIDSMKLTRDSIFESYQRRYEQLQKPKSTELD